MDIRAIPNVTVAMNEPVIAKGLPDDKYLFVPGGSGLETSDTYFGDSEDEDDDYVWRVRDLASPGDTQIPITEWPEANGGPSWESSGDYRPRISKRVNRSVSEPKTEKVQAKSLRFGRFPHEHMWLDLGEAYPTITVMIAMFFDGFRRDHYVLDAGRETPSFSDTDEAGKYKGHQFGDDLDYRATMFYTDERGIVSTTDSPYIRAGKHIGVRNISSHRPRVLYSVFDGNNSRQGWISNKTHVHKTGSLEPANIRRLVLGRRQNRVGKNYSSHMTVYEVRIYTRALTMKQIKKKSAVMHGRYDFNKYGN